MILDLPYRHVDVFSSRALAGNGLIVVLDAGALAADVMLAVTREMRQFETTFVTSMDLAASTARVRIFTEDEELAFAGHPVLGTAAVLHDLLLETMGVERAGAAEQRWALEVGGRRLDVRTRRMTDRVLATMDQGVASFGEPVDPDLRSVYVGALDLSLDEQVSDLPMQVVSTGLPYLIVPVTPSGLERARIVRPDFEGLLARSGAKFAYLLDPERPEGRTWDNAGRVEDIATGSAAGPAAAYLVRHGLRRSDEPVLVQQGRFVGRPSTIEVRHDADEHVWIAGDVTPVAVGRFAARIS